MLTIISTILGIISSAIPGILKYLAQRETDSHELDMARLKLEAASKGLRMTEEATVASQADPLARDPEASIWVVNTRAMVRPVITFAFFAIFVFVKAGSAWVLVLHEGLTPQNIQQVSTLVLDDPYMAVFSTIVGFWFGMRSLEKYMPISPVKSINKR